MWSNQYCYFTIQKDQLLYEDLDIELVKNLLSQTGYLEQISEQEYKNRDGSPWLTVNILQAKDGNYSITSISPKKVNLISIIGSKYSDESMVEIKKMLLLIAQKLNWKLFTEEDGNGIEYVEVTTPIGESKFQENVTRIIDEFGCYIIHVINTTEDVENEPEFSYSIGLFERFKQPEIIIVGLKKDLRHTLINNICNDYKEGKYLEINKYNSDILDNFECLVVEVEKKYFDKYLGQALRYYQNESFKALQVIYPTIQGLFPWDENFPKNVIEPVLNDELKVKEIKK